MIETHPFGYFSPLKAKYLLLGSFTGKPEPGYDWFYASKRNKFWIILRQIYNRPLVTRSEKEQLFSDLSLAISDIIYQCERRKGSNLDMNLVNIVYNVEAIEKLLATNPIERIYFSSRFVEGRFKSKFKYLIHKYPHIELITLPSPSPRYAAMTLEEKIRRYTQLLPRQH